MSMPPSSAPAILDDEVDELVRTWECDPLQLAATLRAHYRRQRRIELARVRRMVDRAVGGTPLRMRLLSRTRTTL